MLLPLSGLIVKNSKAFQIFFARTLSISSVYYGKHPKSFFIKKRQRNNNYGVIADTPDWSFLDGRPAPPGSRALERKNIQRQICEQIIRLNAEIENSKRLADKRRDSILKRVSARNASRFKEKSSC